MRLIMHRKRQKASHEALKKALHEVAETTDLKMKSKDFVHLLINNNQANKVLLFDNIIN